MVNWLELRAESMKMQKIALSRILSFIYRLVKELAHFTTAPPPRNCLISMIQPLFDADKPFLFDVGRVLAEYDKKREWRKQARAYYLYTFEKMTQEAICNDPKIKTDQSSVSKLIKSMRGELSRLAGRDYELFTAERLKTAGYDVKIGGRVSEPDIIAKMGAVHKVYSCKCLDYNKKTTISASEFRPEIQYALSTGARLVLAIHNLHDATDKYIEQDATDFPKLITLRP